MKSILIFLFSGFVLQANAQTVKTATGFPECPVGYCPSVTMTIGLSNFHKPRTSCTSGFGLCIQITTSASCNPCTGKTAISGDKATVWVKLSDQQAEVHIPAAVKMQKGFEKADFSKFEIDDSYLTFKTANGWSKTVKGGIYPVAAAGDEMIVVMDLY